MNYELLVLRLTEGRYLLLCYGLMSLVVYGGMTWLSYAFVYGQGHRQRPIFPFLGFYSAAFLLYWLALRTLPHLWRPRWDIGLVLGFALLFRVALLWSNPIQEDDFYRYLWDGQVVASGLNPYRFAPQIVESYTGGDEDLQRYAQLTKEDPRIAAVLSRVNHSDVPTIYPPLAQGMFAIAAWLAPGSLLALRLLFLAFDLSLCVLIATLLRCLGMNPAYVLIYAWSPLVLKESINSAHYDVVSTFFLIVALWCSLTHKALLAHGSLALAVLGKVYPLLFFPLLLWRTWQLHSRKQALSGSVLVAVVIAVGYLPFVDAGPALWQGTHVFVERWQTNSLLFPLLAHLVGDRWVANLVVIVLLSGLVIGVLRCGDLLDGCSFLWSVFVILGGLLLLSPVGNPWYFLWAIPLLCVFPLRSWLLLSGLLGLYYLSFYFMYHRTPETFRWIIWLEYVPFYAILMWEWATLRSRNGFAPPAESFLRPAVQSLS